MFSKILTSAALLAAATGTLAQDATTPQHPTQSGFSPDVSIALDSDRYVRTELDWRSYYLNRAPAHSRPLSWGQAPGEQAPFAELDPLSRTP